MCSRLRAFVTADSDIATAVGVIGSVLPGAFHNVAQDSDSWLHQPAIHGRQSGFDLGMAYGEQFEFQRQQAPAAILANGKEKLPEGAATWPRDPERCASSARRCRCATRFHLPAGRRINLPCCRSWRRRRRACSRLRRRSPQVWRLRIHRAQKSFPLRGSAGRELLPERSW